MPPKHKKPGANVRDRRHENGLAPPARQIKRQKSDGLLNGHADFEAASVSVAAFDSYPSGTASDNDAQSLRSSPSDMSTDPTNPNASLDAFHSPAILSHQTPNEALPPAVSQPQSAPNIQEHGGDHVLAERSVLGGEVTPTVIAPWSVVDIIAILMVLMQLPSSIVTLVNVTFAFLTFGAPPGSWSASSVVSASEWLQGHGGNPSFVTMVFLDVLFLGLWALAPIWAKDVFLDFSQAVVAISLGGCSSGVHAKLNGIVSIGLICIYHLLSQDTAWRNIPLKVVAYVTSLATANTSLGTVEYRDILDILDIVPDGGRNWPRILLEVHIVTQGIVRVLRRSLVRTSVPRSTNKKLAATEISGGSALVETSVEAARAVSSDARQPVAPSANRDAREKGVSSGKKRRKQATFVRSKQPFWAAIASAKVTVTKEIEQSQSSRDSFEAGASSAGQLGSASNNCFADSFWISDVFDTEVWYSAVAFVARGAQSVEIAPGHDSVVPDAGIDVYVNGTQWTQTSTILRGQRDSRVLLTGKIFGLTPLTNYQIEFAQSRSHSTVSLVNLLTRPHASLEEMTAATPSMEGNFRPSSPLSTLRQSINAATASLSDHRGRSKKTKKEHKSTTNALRREVDVIENRLSSWSGNDERQRQRQIQFRQNIKQAEDSHENISEEIEHLGEVPEGDLQIARESRSRFKEQEQAHNAVREEVDAARASRDRLISAAKAESAQQQQKHDRLAARLNKLNSQRDSLLAAAAQDSRDQHQRNLHRLSEVQSRVDTERSYSGNIQRLRGEREALAEQQTRLELQIAHFDAGQHTFLPDGNVAIANGNGGENSFASVSQTPSFPPAFALVGHRRDSQLLSKPGRSSSMLSNISAYTDDEIGTPQQHASFQNGYPVNGAKFSSPLADRQGSADSADGPHASPSRPATTSPQPRVSPLGVGRASPLSSRERAPHSIDQDPRGAAR